MVPDSISIWQCQQNRILTIFDAFCRQAAPDGGHRTASGLVPGQAGRVKITDIRLHRGAPVGRWPAYSITSEPQPLGIPVRFKSAENALMLAQQETVKINWITICLFICRQDVGKKGRVSVMNGLGLNCQLSAPCFGLLLKRCLRDCFQT